MSSTIESLVNREYQYGFTTDFEAETLPPGLSEETVRFISAKKGEPQWLLDWRLKAFRRWLTMKEPHWGNVQYPPIDYQAASYYSAPKSVKPLASLDDVADAGLRLAGTSSHAFPGRTVVEHTAADLTGRLAIVMGNEAAGLPDEWDDEHGPIGTWVTIRHRGRSESLNVAMAATILVFEAARQRSDEV